MCETSVTVPFSFQAPGKRYQISETTIWRATSQLGIRDLLPGKPLYPFEVLKHWPIDGWAVLEAAIAIDHPGRSLERYCATENTERQSGSTMTAICRRLIEVATEIYSLPMERIAMCECTVWGDLDGLPVADIDRVTVDGVVMSDEDFDRYIDPAKVKAAAIQAAEQQGDCDGV